MADQHREKVHGRRKGKALRGRQAVLMEEWLPELRINVEPDGLEGLAELAQPKKLFSADVDDIWLEIGFGGGEHLLHMLDNHPDIGFIGCEPFINGVAKLMGGLDDRERGGNIRLVDDDARPLIRTLGAATISRIYLLYPDPWHKKRHNKRRFVSPENLKEFHRILKPGGQFFFASDIEHYVNWTVTHVKKSELFDWQGEKLEDWWQPFEGWPGTRYEAKAFREGRKAHYLRFIKR